MDPVTIAMLAGGLFQTVGGLFGKGKAAHEALQNIRPTYTESPYARDVYNATRSTAGQGFSDAALQNYTTTANRGLTASIDAILKSGGDPSMVSEAQDGFQQGLSRMSIADDSLRFKNFDRFVEASTNLSNERDKAFQFNQVGPWADKAQAIAREGQEATQNISNGLNTMLSVGSSYLMGETNPDTGVPVPGRGGSSSSARDNSTNGAARGIITPQFRSSVSSSTPLMSNSVPRINYTNRAQNIMPSLGIRPIINGYDIYNTENEDMARMLNPNYYPNYID